MKAIIQNSPVKALALELGDFPEPHIPCAGYIKIKVKAVGLNPVDYKLARNGNDAWSYPHVLGLDFAGEVVKIAEDVTSLAVGDPVFGHGSLAAYGCFAEYYITTAHTVSKMPAGLTFIDAAALPCAGFTAYQALFRKLKVESGKSKTSGSGKTILVNGAAGGVGQFAVQLASLPAYACLQVFATCSQADVDWVKALGADVALDYRLDDVYQVMREQNGGRGFDYIIDTAGRATEMLPLLACNGALACVAALPDFTKFKAFPMASAVHAVALGGAHLSGDRRAQEDLAKIGDELAALVAQGSIKPMVELVVSMSEIPQALHQLSKGGVRGKIVATIA